jgi:hypothetical protein
MLGKLVSSTWSNGCSYSDDKPIFVDIGTEGGREGERERERLREIERERERRERE